jgi:type II secretory pathway pseudopilin PulG
MTLVEMTIALCVTLVSIFLLAGWTGNMREGSKRALAERVLSDLDVALTRYYHATGRYPASHAPDSAIQATVYLLDCDRTRPILMAFPPSVWSGPGRRNLVDPWGTPLRFYPADSESPYVKANEGRPVFVSAGPDCGFGDLDASQLGDNLRSDDPGTEGFRLDDLMREPRAEREQQHVQEDNRSGSGQ